MSRHKYYAYVAQMLCTYPGIAQEENNSHSKQQVKEVTTGSSSVHRAEAVLRGIRCAVCAIEWAFTRNENDSGLFHGMKRNVARCAVCSVPAHPTAPAQKHIIHETHEFRGMSCFKIMHSTLGMEIWKRIPPSDVRGRTAYTRNDRHPFMVRLQESYGLSSIPRKRKTREEETTEEKTND